MAFEGRLATVGYVDGILQSEIDLQALHAKRLVLFGVSSVYPFAQLEAARKHMEANRHLGKIVLAMPACAPGKQLG